MRKLAAGAVFSQTHTVIACHVREVCAHLFNAQNREVFQVLQNIKFQRPERHVKPCADKSPSFFGLAYTACS
jgi:hypothetical protein